MRKLLVFEKYLWKICPNGHRSLRVADNLWSASVERYSSRICSTRIICRKDFGRERFHAVPAGGRLGYHQRGKAIRWIIWFENVQSSVCVGIVFGVYDLHTRIRPLFLMIDIYLLFALFKNKRWRVRTGCPLSLRRLPPLVFWSIPFPNVTTPHNRPFKSTARLRRNLNCIRSKQISNTKSVSHVFASLIRPRFVPVRDGEF